MDPLIYLDDGRMYKEWMYLQSNATINEAMLVALAHMQVNFVYLRSYQNQLTGMTCFHKNVISFPQELLELQDLRNFFSTLEINDIVNARVQYSKDVPSVLQRARVVDLQADHLKVEVEHDDELHELRVKYEDIEKRVSLPWKPKDLRDHLIVFRR